MKPVIYIIAGPTAVGKTELSLQWAEQNNAEILSCDAYCVYRGMDIGTAKPTFEEQSRVPHHGIDLVPCSRNFSVAEYVEYASDTVRDIFSRGRNVLVAGGSGFYLKSFLAPVVDGIEVGEAVKEKVALFFEQGGLDVAVKELLRLNPDGVGSMDLKNPRRVENALERCLASGKTVLDLKASFESQGTPFDDFEKKVCCLMRDREELKERIFLRAQQMVEQGLIDEVAGLIDVGIEQNRSASTAIGYRETIEWLHSGNTNRSVLVEEISQNTVKLLKKQMTWLRTQLAEKREYNLSMEGKGDPQELFL